MPRKKSLAYIGIGENWSESGIPRLEAGECSPDQSVSLLTLFSFIFLQSTFVFKKRTKKYRKFTFSLQNKVALNGYSTSQNSDFITMFIPLKCDKRKSKLIDRFHLLLYDSALDMDGFGTPLFAPMRSCPCPSSCFSSCFDSSLTCSMCSVEVRVALSCFNSFFACDKLC